MRKDTLLIVLGFAVVAAATYFILDATLVHPNPQLAPVVSEQPPVVSEKQAAHSEKAEELADAGMTPAQQVVADKHAKPSASDQDADDVAPEDGDDEATDGLMPSTDPDAQAAPENSEDDVSAPAVDATDSTENPTANSDDAVTAATDDSKVGDGVANEPQELVAKTTINLREQGDKQAAVIGKLAPGEHVSVVAAPTGDWVKVKNGDKQGWVFRSLLKAAQ